MTVIIIVATPISAPALGWTEFPRPDEKPVDLGEVVVDQRFHPIRELGRGGMGCVVLCEDRVLRSRAAVKILLAQDRESRQRFREEATLLANIRHPHLVHVLTVGETEAGAPYMAMEHLGASLAERLATGEPLPWREVVASAGQVAAALAALHRAGVIHRDVKPENIVALRGITGQTFVKLIDLGIARIDDIAEIQAGGTPHPRRRRTEIGRRLGTPGYSPPEAGLEAPSPSFDLYSLGATIYRLCTGVMPNPLERRSMREVRPDLELPPALDALVERALSFLPEERPESAASFARELALIGAAADHGRRPAILFDGCYELFEVLGIGAKAEVHRAYHRDARRYAALKVLREEVLENVEERRRFDREARILASLDHPVLPDLLDCRTSLQRRRPFIAMEHRRGESVSQLVRLSPREVVEIGRQLASALAAMHSRGIVHRDLNRSNILVERFDDGRAPRASIIDFGQAELTDAFYAAADERYPTRPELRAVLGSGGLEHADWTAPEARAGEGWSTKSDAFSLGLLLFYLLTGKRPTHESPGVWRSPAEHVPECQGPLAETILAALHEDPAYRLDAAGVVEGLAWAAPEFEGFAAAPEPAPPRTASAPRPALVDAGTRRSLPSLGFGALFVAAALTAWALVGRPQLSDGLNSASFARSVRAAVGSVAPEAAPERHTDPPPSSARSLEVEPSENLDPPADTQKAETRPKRSLTMEKALRLVEPRLRACSRLADGLLLVEFATDGSDRFAAITPVAETDPALLQCVRRATKTIRFAPTHRPNFIEEYRP